MTQTSDPYAVLGVPRSASDLQVRRAYLRLVKRHHPDLQTDAASAAEMGRINQAWETLSSPARRARYDAHSAWRGTPSFGHWSPATPRAAQPASPSQQWSPGWAYESPGRAYRHPSATDDDEGPGWLTIAFSVVLGLVAIATLFSGILPFPLFGIAVLVLVRWIFGRYD